MAPFADVNADKGDTSEFVFVNAHYPEVLERKEAWINGIEASKVEKG
jgi:hypothetical protein